MVQYWRAAGVSYLRYSNLCADALRSALKPAAAKKGAAKTPFSMTKSTWEAGKPVARGMFLIHGEGVAGVLRDPPVEGWAGWDGWECHWGEWVTRPVGFLVWAVSVHVVFHVGPPVGVLADFVVRALTMMRLLPLSSLCRTRLGGVQCNWSRRGWRPRRWASKCDRHRLPEWLAWVAGALRQGLLIAVGDHLRCQ